MDIALWTVDELLRAAPSSAPVLNRNGIDTCCGGSLTLEAAARSAGITLDELQRQLRSALEAA
jgi:regulator of cell morphogenesis and NO signaling